jgi:acetolactate synthase-1/2/3 large subunit
MKVSDYIVRFLEKENTTDVFGYPGVGCGHFMDSLSKSGITSHLVYHEQAASFAACSYAQASHKVGIAYTTAGPGGTNLITGIANAYCDSIPTIFIVGDKDLSSLRNSHNVRQLASQEIDIVGIAAPTTKWSYQVTNKEEIRFVLEKAFYTAVRGRPGPVLLDIPSDIQRSDVDVTALKSFENPEEPNYIGYTTLIASKLNDSKKPLFLVGNGVKQAGLESTIQAISNHLNIPIVTTLVCFDLFTDGANKIGYIGMDGDVAANKAVNDCDLLVSFGARLNFKQVCNNRSGFAPNAKVIRIDCDHGELEYKLRDELEVCADINYLIPQLSEALKELNPFKNEWLQQCQANKRQSQRNQAMNSIAADVVSTISKDIQVGTPITVDTGSHRRWVMEQFQFKDGQRMYQSAGLVSMGYSVPAAIGVYYATKRPVICFDGDGGIMMNLQELQFINRDKLPVTIVLMNNHCLGDIMEFQKKIFDGNYYTTTEETGYQSADFEAIAKAFHLKYKKVLSADDLEGIDFTSFEPQLVEIIVPSNVG